MRRGDNFEPWWDHSRRGRGGARHRAIFTAIGTWLTATFGAFLAGVIGNIAVGAALLGASALFSANRGPQTSTPQAQANINQSAGQRIRGYGRAKLGGTRAFFDSKDGALDQITMAHHGEVDAFEQFYIGDRPVDRDVNGNVTTAPFSPWIGIGEKFGEADQLADPTMMANWPGVWTSAHRLRGIAYWQARFQSPLAEDLQTIFPESYNTPITCIMRLSKVWDPRQPGQSATNPATWAWRDNAGLCILDYLRHPDGYRLGIDDVDIPSFIAFANTCDEVVPLASGGSTVRYRLWGVYGFLDDPADVLAKMRAACDAEFYQTPEGKVAIRGGKWQAPTVTITEHDILGHTLEQGNNRFAAFNELKLLYTSSAHDYQTTEATAWIDEPDQEVRGPLPSELRLDMVPSNSQARRLAKIHIAKSNPAWKGTVVTNLSGLNALGERTVRLVLPELEIDDAFFVAGLSISPELDRVELSLMSISEQAYAWTTAEEGAPPAIPTDTRPDLSLPVPSVPVLSVNALKTVFAEVDAPDSSGLQLQAQIRAGAGSLWREMFVDDGSVIAEFGPADPGIQQVRARWRGQLNTAGGWTSPLAEITVP